MGQQASRLIKSSPPPKQKPLIAAEKTFKTVELLEDILSYLPTRDLLLSQRTCRNFRDTIQGSVVLKRKLFLAPQEDPYLITLNPLLIRVAPDVVDPLPVLDFFKEQDPPTHKSPHFQLIAADRSFKGGCYTSEGFYHAGSALAFSHKTLDHEFLHIELRELGPTDEINLVSAASSAWDMYLSQPPMETRVTIWREEPVPNTIRYSRVLHKFVLPGGTVEEILVQIEKTKLLKRKKMEEAETDKDLKELVKKQALLDATNKVPMWVPGLW